MTPERIEAVLGDFRSWLHELAERQEAPSQAEPVPPIDLHTLLAQFTALRHEVHLQTRSARTQQEQNAETLQQLSKAMASLQRHEEAEQVEVQQAEDELLRPLLKTLVDLADALALARREVVRGREALLSSLEPLSQVPETRVQAATPPVPEPRSWWQRWFGSPSESRGLAAGAETEPPVPDAQLAADRARRLIDSLVTGYAMSLQRVERALQQHGLEPIPSVGQPFDPERMEVVEVISQTDRPAGEVVEEARRGYLWRGRVFRYAQVAVAKPQFYGESRVRIAKMNGEESSAAPPEDIA